MSDKNPEIPQKIINRIGTSPNPVISMTTVEKNTRTENKALVSQNLPLFKLELNREGELRNIRVLYTRKDDQTAPIHQFAIESYNPPNFRRSHEKYIEGIILEVGPNVRGSNLNSHVLIAHQLEQGKTEPDPNRGIVMDIVLNYANGGKILKLCQSHSSNPTQLLLRLSHALSGEYIGKMNPLSLSDASVIYSALLHLHEIHGLALMATHRKD